MQKFDMERFNLHKLKEVEDVEHHQVKNLNRFPALENLDDDVDYNFHFEYLRCATSEVIKETGLEVNIEKTKHLLISRHQNARKNQIL
jgi:hypothetical protein